MISHRSSVSPGKFKGTVTIREAATGWMACVSNSGEGDNFLCPSIPVLTTAQTHVQRVPGLSRVVNRLERDDDHPPPSSIEDANRCLNTYVTG